MTQPEPLAPLHRRRGLFVYYKVARAHGDRLREAFAHAASPVSPPLPWRAELMRRVDPSGPSARVEASEASTPGDVDPEPDLQTWMEIYWLDEGCDPDWTDGALRRQIEARALAAGVRDLVHGERHYEAFESCA